MTQTVSISADYQKTNSDLIKSLISQLKYENSANRTEIISELKTYKYHTYLRDLIIRELVKKLKIHDLEIRKDILHLLYDFEIINSPYMKFYLKCLLAHISHPNNDYRWSIILLIKEITYQNPTILKPFMKKLILRLDDTFTPIIEDTISILYNLGILYSPLSDVFILKLRSLLSHFDKNVVYSCARALREASTIHPKKLQKISLDKILQNDRYFYGVEELIIGLTEIYRINPDIFTKNMISEISTLFKSPKN